VRWSLRYSHAKPYLFDNSVFWSLTEPVRCVLRGSSFSCFISSYLLYLHFLRKMPPHLYFLSQPDALLKIREAGIRAWLCVTALFATRVSQVQMAVDAAPQQSSPYLLGVGGLFLVSTPRLSYSSSNHRNRRYHGVGIFSQL
jgi:hypothetical protein